MNLAGILKKQIEQEEISSFEEGCMFILVVNFPKPVLRKVTLTVPPRGITMSTNEVGSFFYFLEFDSIKELEQPKIRGRGHPFQNLHNDNRSIIDNHQEAVITMNVGCKDMHQDVFCARLLKRKKCKDLKDLIFVFFDMCHERAIGFLH